MDHSFSQFKATREGGSYPGGLITGRHFCYQTDGPITRGEGGLIGGGRRGEGKLISGILQYQVISANFLRSNFKGPFSANGN